MAVYSTVCPGNTRTVIDAIASIWIPHGSLVCDLTHNRGASWSKKTKASVSVMGLDILPFRGVSVVGDLRHAPFKHEAFDAVFLDPPFGNFGTKPRNNGVAQAYNLGSSLTITSVKSLYTGGLLEAKRILRPNGVAIVKCQDGVNSGRKHWFTVFVHQVGVSTGFSVVDRFLGLPKAIPYVNPSTKQQHGREWGSTYWVFRKPLRTKETPCN